MVAAPPQAPEVGSQAPEFGPFEFCVWRQLCTFSEDHCWPRCLPRPPGGPSLVMWLRPLEATMPFSMVPATGLAEVGPPRPLSLAPLNFASGGNYALFPRSIVGPPPLPQPPGGQGLVIWLRGIMTSV